MVVKYYPHSLGSFYFKQEILFFKYKPAQDVNLSQAKSVTKLRLRLQNNRAYPLFCFASNLLYIERDARVYFANQGVLLTKAVCFFTKHEATSAIFHFFSLIHKPSIPVLITPNKENGISFLKDFT